MADILDHASLDDPARSGYSHDCSAGVATRGAKVSGRVAFFNADVSAVNDGSSYDKARRSNPANYEGS